MIAVVSLAHSIAPASLPAREPAERRLISTDAIVSTSAQPIGRDKHNDSQNEVVWQSRRTEMRDEPATYHDPKVQEREKLQQAAEAKQQRQQAAEVQSLAQRDREVRAHEQAHAAVGGQYAGAASYQYQRGPDGVNYAVSGEVPISTGREATPEETLRKAQIVRCAALAPAEPSAQDRRVAALASKLEAEARLELALEQQGMVKTDAEQRMHAMDDISSRNHPVDPVPSSVHADSVDRNHHQRRDERGAENVNTVRRSSELAIFRAIDQHSATGRFYEKA